MPGEEREWEARDHDGHGPFSVERGKGPTLEVAVRNLDTDPYHATSREGTD